VIRIGTRVVYYRFCDPTAVDEAVGRRVNKFEKGTVAEHDPHRVRGERGDCWLVNWDLGGSCYMSRWEVERV